MMSKAEEVKNGKPFPRNILIVSKTTGKTEYFYDLPINWKQARDKLIKLRKARGERFEFYLVKIKRFR
jgi:hypothetical protein